MKSMKDWLEDREDPQPIEILCPGDSVIVKKNPSTMSTGFRYRGISGLNGTIDRVNQTGDQVMYLVKITDDPSESPIVDHKLVWISAADVVLDATQTLVQHARMPISERLKPCPPLSSTDPETESPKS